MSYFHVRITHQGNRYSPEVRLDLGMDELSNRFLKPREEGKPIVIQGVVVKPEEIQVIKIHKTDFPSDQLRHLAMQNKDANPMPVSLEWYLADLGADVTDEFITGPPGQGSETQARSHNQPNSIASTELFDILITNMDLRTASRQLFVNGHYRNAVEDAFILLERKVQENLTSQSSELVSCAESSVERSPFWL